MIQKKNARPIGLGSGLSSLLGAEVEKNTDNYKMIPLEFIKAGPWQPRKIFDKDELKSLSNSIKKQGIIQPVILKSKDTIKNQYFIVAGERRWRACQLAKIHEIPAIIRDDINEDKIAELSLVENIQRSELNPIEEAEGYQSLLSNYNYTQEDISKSVGKYCLSSGLCKTILSRGLGRISEHCGGMTDNSCRYGNTGVFCSNSVNLNLLQCSPKSLRKGP